MTATPRLRWLTRPEEVTPAMAGQLLACWRDVSNAGGSVGFPVVPVDDAEVGRAVESLVASLDDDTRLLWVGEDAELSAWLVLARNRERIFRHWATLRRVQTALPARGRGLGRVLLAEAARSARDDLGLAHLHLYVRAGEGLEPFYLRQGYREIGRWPAALRIGHGADLRDEVLLFLEL